MPQTAVPSSDLTVGTYTDQASGSSNIFNSIDEGTTSPNDSDYIQSVAAPSNEVYVCKLSSVTDPGVDTGTFQINLRARVTGEASCAIKVQLRQGYVSEGTPGTLIKEFTQTISSGSFTTINLTLTSGDVALISDFTDLYVRIIAGV